MDKTTIDQYIGRIVVLLSPIFVAVSLVIVNWVQKHLGVHLDQSQLTQLGLGLFAAIIMWLYNRGKYDVAKAHIDEYPPPLPYGPNTAASPEPAHAQDDPLDDPKPQEQGDAQV